MSTHTSRKNFFLFITLSFLPVSYCYLSTIKENNNVPQKEVKIAPNPTISKIVVEGNKHVKTQTILNRIPYKVGTKFDKALSKTTINNVYALGYFRQVQLETDIDKNNKTVLYIVVEEKKLLEKIEFVGNKQIKTKKIKEDLSLDKLTTINEETMQRISNAIKKMYEKENFHNVQIITEIVPNKDVPDKAAVVFSITEGKKSFVSRVYFEGNEKILDRKLRSIIFAREEWIGSFMDEAGKYDKDALEMDKHRIEYFYKDNGYIMATVAHTDVSFSENTRKVFITFHIKEGEQFTIRKLNAAADDVFDTKTIEEKIVMEKESPYSQSKLIESINNIKALYGEKGYIFADVYPQLIPDENSNEVDVTFHVEKGKPLYVRRINITGNNITHDKVIRRNIELDEGSLITSKKLNHSKSNVEYLGYFQKDGVNWKIHRVSEEEADLEMNVRETKTGNLSAGLTYGSDKFTSQPSLRGSVNVEKRNLFGMGWDTAFSIQGNRHRLQKLQASFFEPSIFDSDISGYFSIYKRWEDYEQWHNVNKTPKEAVTGGFFRFGVHLPEIDRRLQLLIELGAENIENNQPQAIGANTIIFQPIVDKTFQQGTLLWLGVDLVKDTRNHQIYPNHGHKILLHTKTAFPGINDEYSFFKAELDMSWYTPLIGEDTLVLALHGKGGSVHTIGGLNKKNDNKKKTIPYKELFHMGGQSTVRGFTWGGIGPAWITNDPLGARYAIQFNCELIFPLIADYSMKGHLFYDAGAGWSTPKDNIPIRQFVKRDEFNLRHSVGFGLNLMKPVPAKIDWGYKLDRDKKAGESPHEFHLSMNYAW